MKQANGTLLFNGMQDIWTFMKISKMTNAVGDEQPFEHLTRSKKFGN
jgi:hypothetical protein